MASLTINTCALLTKSYPYGSILRCENMSLKKRITALILDNKVRVLRLNDKTWSSATLPTHETMAEFETWLQSQFDVTRMTLEVRGNSPQKNKVAQLPLPAPVPQPSQPNPGSKIRGVVEGDVRVTAIVGSDEKIRILRLGSRTWTSFPNRMDQYVFDSYSNFLKTYPLTNITITTH